MLLSFRAEPEGRSREICPSAHSMQEVTSPGSLHGGSSILLRGLRSASLHFGPSHRFLRGLRPLVSGGPRPLPLSGGGQASQKQLLPAVVFPYPMAMYFLRVSAKAFVLSLSNRASSCHCRWSMASCHFERSTKCEVEKSAHRPY